MTTADPQIELVLDASAMESYARGHVHVGQVLALAFPDGSKGRVAIPAVALAEAYSRRHADELGCSRLDLLTSLHSTTVMDLGLPEACEVGAAAGNGDIPRTHAVWLARQHDAFFLTTEPKDVVGLLRENAIVAIPTEDA